MCQDHLTFGINRDPTSALLAEAGIGTSVHFIPVHHLPYFRNLLGLEACGELAAGDKLFPQLLSLPMGSKVYQDTKSCPVSASQAGLRSSRRDS
jgi:dTDP-4-amino-4,6-dideoxygalactose transaminase